MVVDIGGPARTLAWGHLSSLWTLPELAGVVVSPEVHGWADVSGPGCWPTSGEMNAWRPSFRRLMDGGTLSITAYKNGTARLYATVVDPHHTPPAPADEPVPPPPPLPGLLANCAAPLHLFDFD